MGGANLGKSINKPQKAGPWSLGEGGAMGEAGRRVISGGGMGSDTQQLRIMSKTLPFWKGVSGEEKPYEPPKVQTGERKNWSLGEGGEIGDIGRRVMGGMGVGTDSLRTLLGTLRRRRTGSRFIY